MERSTNNNIRLKKAFSIEGLVMLIIIIGFFTYMSYAMDGAVNMFNTFMNTAYDLLIKTVFYIMAIAVLAGAFAALISEFGVVSIINRLLSKVMKPLYNMPGAATLGVVTTYLSDNPAVLTLAKDKGFRNYFKRYQLPAITNLGTAFGMGLVVTTYMIAQGTKAENGNFVIAALVGNIGAIIGSIVSVRLMLYFTKKFYGEDADPKNTGEAEYDYLQYREVREGSTLERALDATLEGGKSGVELGLAIVPGVLIICTMVMMLTNGAGEDGLYMGEAYEGINLLPRIAEFFDFIIQPLFGFTSAEAIAFPITAIGAVGAALGLVPKLLESGAIGSIDIAVFTAIGMCWSGYLSTHVAMMDGLNARSLTGKAILSHTIGGLVAGVSAHYIYKYFDVFYLLIIVELIILYYLIKALFKLIRQWRNRKTLTSILYVINRVLVFAFLGLGVYNAYSIYQYKKYFSLITLIIIIQYFILYYSTKQISRLINKRNNRKLRFSRFYSYIWGICVVALSSYFLYTIVS